MESRLARKVMPESTAGLAPRLADELTLELAPHKKRILGKITKVFI